MYVLRRFLSCALLPSLALLAGCSLFSADAWRGPSPLSGTPPPQEKQEKHEIEGGFTVLAEAPGYPPAARVIVDIEAFAAQRGFVRQSAKVAPAFDPATHQPLPPAPARFILGNIVLDVSFRSADLHVLAYLHSFSSQLSRKFADQFYHGFDQAYGRRYGEEDPIIQSDYTDDSSGPQRGR